MRKITSYITLCFFWFVSFPENAYSNRFAVNEPQKIIKAAELPRSGIKEKPHSAVIVQEPHKTATYIKVWGFLKYYHPTIAKGKLDWDEEFFKGLKQIQTLNNKEDLNTFYLNLLNRLGKVPLCKTCDVPVKNKLSSSSVKSDESLSGTHQPVQDITKTPEIFGADMSWLSDTTLFNAAIIEKLKFIYQNPYQGKHHYISKTKEVGNPIFKNEKVYKDSIYPSKSLRLLTLARYWNMVNYYFPYRYQTDQKWNDVLQEMTPKFISAPDTATYHLAIREIITKIDDSHAKFNSASLERHFGLFWEPFKYIIIDQKAVVVGYYNEKLAKDADIQIGDVIEELNGKPIDQHLQGIYKYIGASNMSVKNRDAHTILFKSHQPSSQVLIERNGQRVTKSIPLYRFKALGYTWGQDTPKDTIKILENNIGYVFMGNLVQAQVPQLIEKLQNTKAIIFDVRNYPKGTLYHLANFLNPKPVPFVKFSQTNPQKPGTFMSKSYTIYAGASNPNYYKGKVILLANENSQSHAEFTLMALQTAPNVTLIGSQTSGADGNVSLITLPGNFRTYITGIGIFYPDGRITQRIGIVPDIEVKPTVAGIRAGRDEVLEKALEIINKPVNN